MSATITDGTPRLYRSTFNKTVFARKHCDFNRLYALFCDFSLSFRDIGAMLGTSGERIRQVYRKHFREIFAGIDRYEREALRAKQEKELEEPIRLALSLVWDEVKSLSPPVSISRIHVPSGRLSNALLCVNGNTCLIYYSHSAILLPRFTRRYHRFYFKPERLTRFACQYAIFVTEIIGEQQVRFFVIPVALLLEKYGKGNGQFACVYLPTEKKTKYKVTHPRINWWEHENAWPKS